MNEKLNNKPQSLYAHLSKVERYERFKNQLDERSGLLETDGDYIQTLERARKNLGLEIDSEGEVFEVKSKEFEPKQDVVSELSQSDLTDSKKSTSNQFLEDNLQENRLASPELDRYWAKLRKKLENEGTDLPIPNTKFINEPDIKSQLFKDSESDPEKKLLLILLGIISAEKIKIKFSLPAYGKDNNFQVNIDFELEIQPAKRVPRTKRRSAHIIPAVYSFDSTSPNFRKKQRFSLSAVSKNIRLNWEFLTSYLSVDLLAEIQDLKPSISNPETFGEIAENLKQEELERAKRVRLAGIEKGYYSKIVFYKPNSQDKVTYYLKDLGTPSNSGDRQHIVEVISPDAEEIIPPSGKTTYSNYLQKVEFMSSDWLLEHFLKDRKQDLSMKPNSSSIEDEDRRLDEKIKQWDKYFDDKKSELEAEMKSKFKQNNLPLNGSTETCEAAIAEINSFDVDIAKKVIPEELRGSIDFSSNTEIRHYRHPRLTGSFNFVRDKKSNQEVLVSNKIGMYIQRLMNFISYKRVIKTFDSKYYPFIYNIKRTDRREFYGDSGYYFRMTILVESNEEYMQKIGFNEGTTLFSIKSYYLSDWSALKSEFNL
ncbi:MAG: hypothetical protein AAGF07_01140 [Patescibacteria group bacterium]